MSKVECKGCCNLWTNERFFLIRHQWMFLTDTVDAVYRPEDWVPESIMDQLAEIIGDLPDVRVSGRTVVQCLTSPDAHHMRYIAFVSKHRDTSRTGTGSTCRCRSTPPSSSDRDLAKEEEGEAAPTPRLGSTRIRIRGDRCWRPSERWRASRTSSRSSRTSVCSRTRACTRASQAGRVVVVVLGLG